MWLDANGHKFYAERRGQGEPLLFLGGSGWDLRCPPTPLESPLSKAFDVVLFDQRGAGQSDKPAGPYSMVDYAEDAAGVMDALGWERAHVVGYSFGGMVAQEFAIRFPDRVDKLVLAATSPGGPMHKSYPIEEFVDLPPRERAERSLAISNLNHGLELKRRDPDAFELLVEKRLSSQTAFMDSEAAQAGYRHQLRARAEHDVCERLPLIRAKSLILTGESDGQASRSGQELMANTIPNAWAMSVSGGHNFIFESDEAYQKILAFLIDDNAANQSYDAKPKIDA